MTNEATQPEEPKSNWWRVLFISTATLLILFSGIQLYINLSLEPRLKERIRVWVSNQSDGGYEFQLDDLQLRLLGRRLYIDTPKVVSTSSDSTSPTSSFEAEEIRISGIHFLSYWWNGDVQIRSLRLVHPQIHLVEETGSSRSGLQSYFGGETNNPPGIEIGQVQITDGIFRLISPGQETDRFNINDVQLDFTGIRVDSTSLQKAPYFSFGSVFLLTGSIEYLHPNGRYQLTGSRFGVSSVDAFSFLDSLRLHPTLPKYDFSRSYGREIDRIDLSTSRVALQNFNPGDLFEDGLVAEKLLIEQAELDVFHDKNQPESVKSEKQLPHVALQKLEYPVTVDTLEIRNSLIRYSEHKEGISTPGTVSFNNLSATVTEITNDSSVISGGHTVELQVVTDLMDSTPLRVRASLPLHLKGYHLLDGTLGNMPISRLNPVLEPLGLVRAESGTIHNMAFRMEMDTSQASGYARLEYSDLEIALLEPEDIEGEDNRAILSFLLNTFQVESSNNSEPLREGKVDFDRDPHKSIFHYWWKSLFSGLMDSIGM